MKENSFYSIFCEMIRKQVSLLESPEESFQTLWPDHPSPAHLPSAPPKGHVIHFFNFSFISFLQLAPFIWHMEYIIITVASNDKMKS